MNSTSISSRWIRYVRWFARIFGTFLALSFLALLIPDIIRKKGWTLPHLGHWFMMTTFLLGQAGLLLAWKWEGFGGLLATGAIIVSILLDVTWVHGRNNTFIGFSIWLIPSLLYILCWWQSRIHQENDSMNS